jgi:DNA repair protein RecN (Recombination protein N)
MLDEITARNLGLIASASVRLPPGLTVITGETGTGKTLMLGALRLLRGDNAAKGVIGPAESDTEVSTRLLRDDGGEVVLRRTVDSTRSRAYVDGAAASAAALSDILSPEVAIIGQHDQLTIASAQGVRRLLDRPPSADRDRALQRYRDAWDAHVAVRDEREALGADTMAIERERDILAYQIEEIERAALVDGEDDDLRAAAERLRNADALATEVGAARDLLGDHAEAPGIDSAINALSRAARMDPSLEPLLRRIEDVATELNDVAGELALYGADLDADPDTLERVEGRIAAIGALARKYGPSITEILTFLDEARRRHDAIVATLEAATTIDARFEATERAVREAGAILASERQRVADEVAKRSISELTSLGFRSPVVEIAVEAAEPSALGADRPVIRFASDASLTPGPVGSIASGGELSRLILALTLAAGTSDASVLAFDEIDAGIGGSTALAMGERLAALADVRQVIVVTHLPQVAAFADAHVVVERDGTVATVRELGVEERTRELSRMLAGLTDSEKGREHAEELLEIARGRDRGANGTGSLVADDPLVSSELPNRRTT